MRLFFEDEGFDGVAPIVFWTAAFDWLDSKRG